MLVRKIKIDEIMDYGSVFNDDDEYDIHLLWIILIIL